ncbi:MAG: lysine--tRNA ligase [Candidatus Thermoplasmatota archaeon]|jgi:lysyl-tRNA synthetase class 1|nr:lysine--tRNA ligase [Candidatus Thermoplasmatota archaeon]
MHWADVLADELLKENKKHVLATGITPSGPIHIGNMREILTTDAVYRCVLEKGGDAELIYIADDYDPLRKVYPYLPQSYAEHVGKPICEIPCPCSKHKSYADHFLTSFLNSLKEVGVKPSVYRASEMYKKGLYNESIQIALENTKKIKDILEKISNRKIPKEWLPFNVKCENCGRISTTKPTLYEYPIIEYTCECKYSGEADVRKGGIGKLPWRVDWPARWKMLNVTFEPCGKDLATVGGARETGAKIVEEVYGYPHPALLVYEFIMLKGQGAMHSSRGTALSAEEMLKMTPPEVLRFLIVKNQPNKHIVFDPGLGILDLVDEYDREERVYFAKEKEIKGMKDLKKTYELSQPHSIPKTAPFQLPYKHLVTLIQIGKNWENTKKILIRTGQIPKDLKKEDAEHIKQRIEHVQYWLEKFAPDNIKFEVKEKLPKITLSKEQNIFLSKLKEEIKDLKWEPEEIHKKIYEISEENKIQIKTAFQAIYQIILGQEQGPRAGYFLSNLDKKFVLDRITEAIK